MQTALRRHRLNKERSKHQKHRGISREGGSIGPKKLLEFPNGEEIEEFKNSEIEQFSDYNYEEESETSGDDLYQYES